jgi:hypothetical protein
MTDGRQKGLAKKKKIIYIDICQNRWKLISIGCLLQISNYKGPNDLFLQLLKFWKIKFEVAKNKIKF